MGWAPTAQDVQRVTPGRVIIDDTQTAGWIQSAVAELVATVGYFDDGRVINPGADTGDRVTLGDLARDAAALRAAYDAERRSPEQMSYAALEDGGSSQGRELYARYRDALARLRAWIGTPAGQNLNASPLVGSMPLVLPAVRDRGYAGEGGMDRWPWCN